MRPAELFIRSLARVVTGQKYILLFTTRKPKGAKIKLAKGRGPLGEVMSVTAEGTNALYDSRAVCDWLVKVGAVEVEEQDGRRLVRDDAGPIWVDIQRLPEEDGAPFRVEFTEGREG